MIAEIEADRHAGELLPWPGDEGGQGTHSYTGRRFRSLYRYLPALVRRQAQNSL